ncbi:unnamed protein product [Prunus armeniaca]
MTNDERLCPRLDIRAHLGTQGNVHEKLGPQEGQPRGVITIVCGVVELIFWNISDSRGAKAIGHVRHDRQVVVHIIQAHEAIVTHPTIDMVAPPPHEATDEN